MPSVIKLKGNTNKSIDELFVCLKNVISPNPIEEYIKTYEDTKVGLIVFERFYFRNSSSATLTVLITQSDDIQIVDIIGSGGGQGLFNISWGANSNFANTAKNEFLHHGFEEIENDAIKC